MPRKKRHEVLIGGFICMAVGLFALLLFLMGSLDTLFASSDRVEADFGDVQSLQEGDPVYLFGMKVGKVSSIDLLPLEPGQQAVIRVRLQMPLKYRPYLREDSIVKIDKSLTGNISVLIRESEGKPLPEGGRLKGAPAADFASVTEKANQVLYQGEQLLASVVRVVKEIETKGNLPSTAQNLGDIVEKLKAEILPLGTRIKGVIELVEKVIEENRLDLRNSVANLKETTAQGKTFAEKITSAPEQVTRSLSEIEKAGNSVTSLINENRNHVDSILEDLTLTAANASNLTSEIKRRPWRLLFRPNESEIKAMDLYDAAWAYNLGATELNRSLRDFESHQLRVATGNSSAKDLEAAKARVEQSILKQKQIEELFWEKLRASE